MHYGRLIGVGAMEGAGQRGIRERGLVPYDGAQQIGGGSAGEAGKHPLGLPVQVCETPIGVKGEDAFAHALEQIQRLDGVEQPIEPCEGNRCKLRPWRPRCQAHISRSWLLAAPGGETTGRVASTRVAMSGP
jgi:hypothetical protein